MIRTAIDSSILFDVFIRHSENFDSTASLIRQAIENGCLVVSDVVYAEVSAHFESHREFSDVFVDAEFIFEALSEEACFLAGQIWKAYRSKGGKRDKMIPDFMVAAHAFKQCDRLLTRDRGFYKTYFPKLKML
ncbi:MAG: type II toxin-antitoxin system VapC family toxin [Deltaproteobacteria bacterium]|nr:type II toxin-antitoxin system VapC family toxin [Deltaproteobacteria bacterium]